MASTKCIVKFQSRPALFFVVCFMIVTILNTTTAQSKVTAATIITGTGFTSEKSDLDLLPFTSIEKPPPSSKNLHPNFGLDDAGITFPPTKKPPLLQKQKQYNYITDKKPMVTVVGKTGGFSVAKILKKFQEGPFLSAVLKLKNAIVGKTTGTGGSGLFSGRSSSSWNGFMDSATVPLTLLLIGAFIIDILQRLFPLPFATLAYPLSHPNIDVNTVVPDELDLNLDTYHPTSGSGTEGNFNSENGQNNQNQNQNDVSVNSYDGRNVNPTGSGGGGYGSGPSQQSQGQIQGQTQGQGNNSDGSVPQNYYGWSSSLPGSTADSSDIDWFALYLSSILSNAQQNNQNQTQNQVQNQNQNQIVNTNNSSDNNNNAQNNDQTQITPPAIQSRLSSIELLENFETTDTETDAGNNNNEDSIAEYLEYLAKMEGVDNDNEVVSDNSWTRK